MRAYLNKLYKVCSVRPYPFWGGVYVVIQYSSMLASWDCIFFMPERGQIIVLIDVVGIQHKQGTVEGRPYEFFEVHSLVPDAQVEGQAVDVIKLKPDVLSEVLADVGGLPKNLIGKRLFVDFDRKMRPATVDFWPDKEK